MDHRTIVSFFTCQLVWVNRYKAGTWHVQLSGFSAFSGVTLKASY